MNVVSSAAEIKPGAEGVCVAIGVFDGLHLGHQSVIGRAREDAQARGASVAVVTFDRHPNAIVAPSQVPPTIYPLQKKLEVIAALGVETCCVIPFDRTFSEVTGEQFVRDLVGPGKIVRCISVGETFKFGAKRSGDVALLEKLGQELNFSIYALPDVMLEGQPVSSTRIREAVRRGDFAEASRMLGRSYSLCGQVVPGARMGRQLGFPTANLNVVGTLVPPAGVYVASATVAGKTWRAAVNIGRRPTMYATTDGLTVEAHLLDFSGNIYDEEIELIFLKKLRDEAKYPSLAALQQQIERDVLAARETV